MGWDRLILCQYRDWDGYMREFERAHPEVRTHPGVRMTPGFSDALFELDGTRHTRVTSERDLRGMHDCLFTLFGYWATVSYMDDPALVREIGRLMVMAVQDGHRFYNHRYPIELRPGEEGD